MAVPVHSENPPCQGKAADTSNNHAPKSSWVDSNILSRLQVVSFVFYIYTSVDAIVQSMGDPGTVAFVVGSFLLLGTLYWCVLKFDAAREWWVSAMHGHRLAEGAMPASRNSVLFLCWAMMIGIILPVSQLALAITFVMFNIVLLALLATVAANQQLSSRML